MWALWRSTQYIIRGKVVASPKFGSWWVLWVRVCSWFVLAPKVLKLCTNQLVIGLCRSVWVNKLLFILPSPILELQHAPLPPKCYEPGSMPWLLAMSLFSLQTHIWVYQGAWERVTLNLCIWETLGFMAICCVLAQASNN
jgi:hypothetical protein